MDEGHGEGEELIGDPPGFGVGVKDFVEDPVEHMVGDPLHLLALRSWLAWVEHTHLQLGRELALSWVLPLQVQIPMPHPILSLLGNIDIIQLHQDHRQPNNRHQNQLNKAKAQRFQQQNQEQQRSVWTSPFKLHAQQEQAGSHK